MAQVLATWQAPEFDHTPKSADWYWAVWIIVISISVISILFHDTLLAVLIIIGMLTISLLSNKPPRLIQYEINTDGIRVENILYSYEDLDCFGIEEYEGQIPKLLLKSKKLLVPYIAIPIVGFNSDSIKEILDAYMHEEKLVEPLMQKIVDFLGF